MMNAFKETLKELRDRHNNKIDDHERQWNEWLNDNLDSLKKKVQNAYNDLNNWSPGYTNTYVFDCELKVNITRNKNIFFNEFELAKLLDLGVVSYGGYELAGEYIVGLQKTELNPFCKEYIDKLYSGKDNNWYNLKKKKTFEWEYKKITGNMDIYIDKVVETMTNPTLYKPINKIKKDCVFYVEYIVEIGSQYPELVKQFKNGVLDKINNSQVQVQFNEYLNKIIVRGEIDSSLL